MLYIWKTKDLTFLYSFKLRLRSFKDFIIQTYKLIKIRTSFIIFAQFIKNYFTILDKQDNFINSIYKSYNFEFPDWFSNKIPIFIYSLDKYKFDNKVDILEIGSFEGRSSIFFLNYFKRKIPITNINLTCVDTWMGSNETFHEKIDFNRVEKNFDTNIEYFSKNIKKNKCTSANFFKLNYDHLYDLIFIDGSHEFEDVLLDAKSSFKVLKKGGLIIFDDFIWFHYKNEKLNPAHAINTFLKDSMIIYEVIYAGSILVIKKI